MWNFIPDPSPHPSSTNNPFMSVFFVLPEIFNSNTVIYTFYSLTDST